MPNKATQHTPPAKLNSNCPQLKQLLTDIVMPRIDGVALALKAAKEYPALRIVLMTGYAAERERAHNLDALVHAVVSKPFTLEEICDAIDAALAAPRGGQS